MHQLHLSTLLLVLTHAGSALAAGLPGGSNVLDFDLVWDFRSPASFVLSPEETRVAYVSKGALWVATLTEGPAVKLADLPNTTTAYMATADYREARALFNRVGETDNASRFKDRPADNLTEVFGLQWTPGGLYYALADRERERPWTATYRVVHVTDGGDVEELATVVRNGYDEVNRFTSFDVTEDRDLVVLSDGYRPLICETKTGKPRVTPFDTLVASHGSGRFIGVEIDTRELVVVGPDLAVVERTGVTLPGGKHCELIWSRDEKFVICKVHQQHGLSTNTCYAFRLNLETLDRRELVGDCLREQLAFTGSGGEFLRIGVNEVVVGRHVDGRDGTHVLLVPDGSGPVEKVFSFSHQFKRADRVGLEKPYPPVVFNRDGSLFAMALPRSGGTPSFRYYLINREGRKWPFVPDDPALYNAPYHVLAFAGDFVVACDEARLFAFPVSSIRRPQ